MPNNTSHIPLMYPYWPNYPYPSNGSGLGWPWPPAWQPSLSPRWPWGVYPDPVPPTGDVTRTTTPNSAVQGSSLGDGVNSQTVTPLDPNQFGGRNEPTASTNNQVGQREAYELQQKLMWFIMTLTDAQRTALLEGIRRGIDVPNGQQTRMGGLEGGSLMGPMPWNYAFYATSIFAGAAGWLAGGSKDGIPWEQLKADARDAWLRQ